MFIDLEQGSMLPVNDKSVTYITVILVLISIGMVLSVLSLLLLIITAGVHREWRQVYKNQLLIQFMLARCAYTFTRLFYDLQTVIYFCDGNACIIYLDELAMIYTELLLVAWMYEFTKHMYRSLVIVINVDTSSIWKVSLSTWAGPMIVTSIMYIIYKLQTDRDFLFFLLYLAIVKWPLLISNAVTLIMILKSLIKRNKNNNNNTNSTNNCRLVVVMSLMIFFFCFQQLFVDIGKIIYIILVQEINSSLIILNLFTTYHCSFTIIFWVFGNSNTRKLWRNKISRHKVLLSQTTSLNSNCSTVCIISNQK